MYVCLCVWLWNTWNNPYATDTYLFPILLSFFFSHFPLCALFCFGRFDFWFLAFVRSCCECFSFYIFQFISLFTFFKIVGFCKLDFKAPCTIRPALTQKINTHTHSRSAEWRKKKRNTRINRRIATAAHSQSTHKIIRSLTHTICSHSVKEACTQMNKKIRIEKEKQKSNSSTNNNVHKISKCQNEMKSKHKK